MAAPWVILGRVLRAFPGPQDVDAEEEGFLAADVSVAVALPPRATVLTANGGAHPDPAHPDARPYILAAGPDGILAHFSAEPFHGMQFGVHPLESHLVLARQFHQPGGGETAAAVARVPPRDGSDPIVTNIESIGLVFRDEGDDGADLVIAELMVDKGSEHARLVYCNAGGVCWLEEVLENPLADHDREWVPSGVVAHDEMLWWFDLSWGILSCAPSPHDPELLFHALPEGRTLDATRPGIHDHRCITESDGWLRYVEIIPEGDAATVAMWTGFPVPNHDGDDIITWGMAYAVSFAEIWDDDSYKATGLPQRVPVLTVVCPTNPNLVFFALEQERRLFGVDVPQHRVVEFIDVAYDLVMPLPARPCCRYVLPWLLPQVLIAALHIHPFVGGRQAPPGAIETDDDATESSSD